MKLRLSLLSLLLLCLSAIPMMAQAHVYDNGPTNGTVDAWTINFGFIVSDTFTLASARNIEGFTFAAWLFPGDILESAEVSITSSEFGGTTYFDGTVDLTQSDCVTNQLGFSVCNESGTFDINLNAGTYWLNLQNAVVNNGDPVYWDENSGPSRASENSVGTIPSESFTLYGETGPATTTGTTPEPGSMMLFGSGILGALGFVRRKFQS